MSEEKKDVKPEAEGEEELQFEPQKFTSALEAGQNIIKEKFRKQREKRLNILKQKVKGVFLWIAAAAAIVGLVAIYYFSSAANVRSVKVDGNYFLSEEYIQKESGISTDSKYMFLVTTFRESRLKRNPLIRECEITRGNNHSITIRIEENRIVGYRLSEGKLQLILESGEIVDFESESIKNLAMLPMFMNISDELAVRIATKMQKLSNDILTRISEVRNFALSYDPDMVKLTMDNRYTVYCPVDGIPLVNEYLKIVVNTSSKYSCIFISTSTSTATVMDCKEIESMADKPGSSDLDIKEEKPQQEN